MSKFIGGTIIGILISMAVMYYTEPEPIPNIQIVGPVLRVVEVMDNRDNSEFDYVDGTLCQTYSQWTGHTSERKQQCYTIDELITLGEYYTDTTGGN